MPDILDRCVAQAVGQGHSESSAFAICRSLLGLAQDGTDDGKAHDITEDEMTRRLKKALKMRGFKFENGPTLTKDMIVARVGRNLRNGKEEFDLTEEDIDEIIDNFRALGRQVRIFLGGEHFEGMADRPADGWVNTLRREGKDLVANVKLHGAAATAVQADEFRGISIGTVNGRDMRGKAIGQVLHHLLITNDAFFGELNIAASNQQAGNEGRVTYITACQPKEVTMPIKEKTKEEKEAEALALQEEEPEPEEEMQDDDDEFPESEFTLENFKKMRHLLKKMQRMKLSLEADNETLRGHLKAKSGLATQDKQKLALRVERLEKERNAQAIREVVQEGLSRLTLKGSWVTGYKGEDDDGGLGTLEWLQSSRFADMSDPTNVEAALRTLKYQVFKGNPITKLDQDYEAGRQSADLALTSDEQNLLRTHGIDEEQFKALQKQDGGLAYRALMAKRGKKE